MRRPNLNCCPAPARTYWGTIRCVTIRSYCTEPGHKRWNQILWPMALLWAIKPWWPNDEGRAEDVTWNAAPSRSEILDDLTHATEVIRDRDYRAMLRGQRYVALMHLDDLLDDWCRSYGWEPSDVRRKERPFQKVHVRITVDDQFSHKVDAITYSLYGLQSLLDAKSATVITDATS